MKKRARTSIRLLDLLRSTGSPEEITAISLVASPAYSVTRADLPLIPRQQGAAANGC